MDNINIRVTPKKKGLCLRLLFYYLEILQQFLRNTTLNGLKYLSFKYLTFWEKLLFFICFVAAAYNSFNFAINIVNKWQTSPVIIVMNPEMTWITNEPFPAITICNMNQARNSKVKDYASDSLDYAMLQKLCFQELNYTSFTRAKPRSKDDSFENFIVKNTQPCSHMVAMCQFGYTITNCSDFFREVLLDEGMCCSFNVLHPFMLYKGDYFMVRDFTSIDTQAIAVNWHPENGYPTELPNSFYPRVALGEGITNGLTLILNGDMDEYYCSSTNGPGFKVSLHNPLEIPHIKETGLYVGLGYQSSFRLSTVREEAAGTLRTSQPKERQCYFSDERPLQYFRYYTRRNCEMECDSQFMLRECNCIPYHMPFIWENATICHVRHFDCVVEAEKDYSDKKRLKCKNECLSGCGDLSYLPDIFKTPLARREYGLQDPYFRNFTREYIKENFAILKIFFTENFYRSNVKNPYTGVTEYLSQTGGIMSLMMGFSVISVVELVYFFIFKPFFAFWHRIYQRNIIGVEEVNPDMYVNNLNLQNANIRYQNSYMPNIYLRSQLPPYSIYNDPLRIPNQH